MPAVFARSADIKIKRLEQYNKLPTLVPLSCTMLAGGLSSYCGGELGRKISSVHFTDRRGDLLTICLNFTALQHAKKVVSDSPGLVDFAIGLVNSIFNLPDG